MNALRSALFMPLIVLWTAVFGTLLLLSMLVPLGVRFRIVRYFRRGFMWLTANILGITHEVIGRENLPKEASIMLAKHQSAWETVALQDLVEEHASCVFVLKQELMSIPFIGWGLTHAYPGA